MRALAIIPLCVCLFSSAFAKPPVLLNYQDSDGQYNFGYSDPLSIRTESRTADGLTRGAYSYYDQNGAIQTTEYEAGKDIGFRVKATNLPEAPLPVNETPEVTNARHKHLQLLQEAGRHEQEEKGNLAQLKEAKPEPAVAEDKITPTSNDKEVAPSQIIPIVNIRSQPISDAEFIPGAPVKDNAKSAKISESSSQTIPALPLTQENQEQAENSRAQPLLPEASEPAVQTASAVVQKQQEISSRHLPNQASLIEPNILPEQRAFAAENPFLIPFLGQGFSFEKTLPQERGLSTQQGQETITAENINSELRTASAKSGISEQPAAPKQSSLSAQHAFPVPGIQGRSESQIQNVFSEYPSFNQNGPQGGISTEQFMFLFPGLADRSTAPNQTPQAEQRAFPSQNEVLGHQQQSIQGTLRQQFLNSNGFSGQQGFPAQDALLQQRTVPMQTVQPRQQEFPTLNMRQGQPEQTRQSAFPEQRLLLAQGGLPNTQTLSSVSGFFGQGLFEQNPLLRQQGFLAQPSISEQQSIPRQNVISNQQHEISSQSADVGQQAIARQNVISEQQVKQSDVPQQIVNPQQGISRHNTIPEQQVNHQQSEQQFIQQQSSNFQQLAIPRQHAAVVQQPIPQQSDISRQQPIQQQGLIPDQQAIPRQSTGLEQQPIPQQSAISGHQFIQHQGSILEQRAIPRQNQALVQQPITQQSAISGHQFIQQQASIFEQEAFSRQSEALGQQSIPQQSAISRQQFIEQGSMAEQQAIPSQNAVPEQRTVPQQNTVPGQQLIPQGSISEQQITPRQNTDLEQKEINQQSAISGQQGISQQFTLDQQALERQFLLAQGSDISEQQRIAQLGSIFNQQGEIRNQGAMTRQSVTERQSIPAQAVEPEQRGVASQNLTPGQESLPKGFSIPDQRQFQEDLDQGNLHAQPSNLAAVRVPEPMNLSPEPVNYTPEVMAAREAHFRAHATAARLAEESDRNPQILKQLLRGPAASIVQIAQRLNQLENEEASGSVASSTIASITEDLRTKSAEQMPEKMSEILSEAQKAPEQRISGSMESVEDRKIDSAEKIQPSNVPNLTEHPKLRSGLTPASTSLRVMDTRLPSLNEFQQSKLKEALALAGNPSLKITDDKETTMKADRRLVIVKPVGIAPIKIQKDSTMPQSPAPKNWAFQYFYL